MPHKACGGLAIPTIVSAVATSGLGVLVNFATDWKTDVWAWVGVALITMLIAGVTLWLARRQTQRDDGVSGGPLVQHACIGRDNIQIGEAGGNVTINRDL
jgi:hypothetical protein